MRMSNPTLQGASTCAFCEHFDARCLDCGAPRPSQAGNIYSNCKTGTGRSKAMELGSSEPAPRGRPPLGYVWLEGRCVHPESLAPFSRAEHTAMLAEIWRQSRLRRYRQDENGIRTIHREALARSRRLRGAKPRRMKLSNSLLPPVRSPGGELKGDTHKSSPT